MRGFVAVTDPGWYERLRRTPGPKDANFWRPSTREVRLAPGTPFFFKLKAPHHAIGGFGFFSSFSVLPDWLAWDTFEGANGTADLKELRARLSKIQQGARIEADPQGRIGCCLIAEAQFFPREAWVAAPSDWHARTVTGAAYDLSQGEGARIWQQCQEQAAASDGSRSGLVLQEPTGERYGTPSLRRPRLGQGIFRVQVLDAYGRACAVTGEHSLPVVEAAHIKPYADGGEHRVTNGLALRTDIHRLLDRGYATVDEDLRFVVSRRLKADFDNGHSYYGLQGRPLQVPQDPGLHPSREALAWHRQECFLG